MNKKLECTNIIIPKSAENLNLPSPELLMYYENFENRTIWLDSEIDCTTLEIVKAIIRWNREDEANNVPVEERKPIKIMIWSVGGDLDATNSMISVIKLSRTPVWTINAGIAMSGGAFIFLAGHRKFALQRSTFLLHSGSCDGMAGTAQQIEEYAANYKKQVAELKEYLVEECGIDKALVQKKMRSEWFVDSKQAVEIGIADEVIDDISVLL